LPVLDESAVRTASGVGNANIDGDFYTRGGIFLVDVTAASGTSPTLVVKVQYTVDGVAWHDLDTTGAQTASLTTTGKVVFKVYPGLTAAANAASNNPLPPVHRLAWTIGGTTPSFTFSTAVTYLY
jgi:hypothetical protein